jgi:ligand-binding sensor domain-containing protein
MRTRLEDTSGFFWIGTAVGTFEFEGTRIGLANVRRIVLAIIALFALSATIATTDRAYAQGGDGPPLDLKFTHLTTDDGLSQNNIFAIVQDRQGFMWFATRDGLNRYDGNTFVVYKHNPDDSNREFLSGSLTLPRIARGISGLLAIAVCII